MYFCRLVSRFSLVCLFMMLPMGLMAQGFSEKATALLEKAGFANVRVAENDSVFVVALENDAYKLQASGLAAAIRILDDNGLLGARNVKMIATYYNVPQVTLTYDPVLGDWKTSYKLDDSWKMVRKTKRTNSSFGKVDIAVYPQLSMMNLIITQIYQSLFQLSPALEVSLWPGSKLSYQVKIPIWNDGYGAAESKVHPGMVTLSQRFRVPFDIFGRATVGVFSNNCYGASIELFRPFSFNERFSLEGSFSMVGLCRWDGFVLHYDPDIYPFWSFGANYYWPRVKTQFSLSVRKFLLEDVGMKFEMIRHFRYCSIGFYAEKGLNSYASLNGGFRFQVALPPYRYKRYKYVPRVTTSGMMGMTYNGNNHTQWYREFKTEASDNIMEHNGFNPFYIDSEIRDLNK